MGMLAKIRRMHYREHLSLREIVRRTGLSRNTIRTWLRQVDAVEPKCAPREVATKLDQYADTLTGWLKANEHRNKRERRTLLSMHHELVAMGYRGSYVRVTIFARHYRQAQSLQGSGRAFVPLKFQLGEAFQFDWSTEYAFVGGLRRRLEVAHTKLCASRAFWLTAYFSQSHEMLFDAHAQAFAAFGGIPTRGIYDNMKTAVDKVQKGKGRIVNTRFFAMTAHYLFDPDFCNVASGWEKGIVEKNVQDSRRRVWMEAKALRFNTFGELNAWLEKRCRALWSEVPHPEYADIMVAEVLEQEQVYLMPVPTPFDGYLEVLARVSSTCLVTVQRNRYSVPCHMANGQVAVHLYPESIAIYAQNTLLASHPRLFERDQTRYDWQHYIPLIARKPGALKNGAPFADMPLPLVKLQAELRRRERQMGDRIMAKVLAAVPVYGLEAVLVAVEKVLASGVPSVEHILNVLARLKSSTLPDRVETSLKLNEEPLANTARYDHLHAKEHSHA